MSISPAKLLLPIILLWVFAATADPGIGGVTDILETISQQELAAESELESEPETKPLPESGQVILPQSTTQAVPAKLKKVDAAPKIESKQRKVSTKATQGQIDQYLTQLYELNLEKYNSINDDEINQLLEQQQSLIADLLKVLQQAKITQLTARVDIKRMSFLTSRMALNQDRGNTLALERDRFELENYQTKAQINDYLEYLIHASKSYKTVDEVLSNTDDTLTRLEKDSNEIVLPTQHSESKIFQQLSTNYQHYIATSGAFQDILNYVTINPGEIVKSFWFQKFTLLSIIAKINNLAFLKPANYKLAPLNIDIGGITVSLIILALIITCLPLYISLITWLINRYVISQVGDHSALIIQELRKPLRLLLLFFSLDMATYALLYRTEYKASLANFIFIIYAVIAVWAVCRLFDTLFIIQVEKIARRNKELRKELVNLGIQFAKGGVVVLALTFILNRFGISITAIISTLGIGGLAFALAAKDTLSNLFGGMTILIDNVFRMGDWVRIGNDEGTVAEIGLRSTTIRTFDNALITIPNSIVSIASVKNWNRRAVGRRIKMYIGVTYDADMNDLRQAIDDIRSMLSEHPDISNPKEKYSSGKVRFELSSRADTHGIKSTQLVFLDRYSDFSIDIMIYCFSRTVVWSQWLGVKEDILFKIADILAKNNLEFAYPTEVNINRSGPPVPAPQALLPSEN